MQLGWQQIGLNCPIENDQHYPITDMDARLFIFLIGSYTISLAIINENLIEEFCTSKSSTLGTLFTCTNRINQINIKKKFVSKGFAFLISDLRNENFAVEDYLARNYFHLCVVLDGNCFNFTDALSKVSNVDFISCFVNISQKYRHSYQKKKKKKLWRRFRILETFIYLSIYVYGLKM